ncbi:MAG TPA: hypothetical protein IAC60_03985 [Candidatus Enterosoma merdigallinarum]|nr:hypothetical protein [Candidatus Enterosoma merdigallinarum]
MIVVHHVDKWGYCNLDLVEEVLEKEKKAIVLIAGASSSGKSFCADYLATMLKHNGHHAVTISLDKYNVGLSGIIPNKVNANYFSGGLKDMKTIRKRIKDIIYDVPFDKKYAPEVLDRIADSLSDVIDPSCMPTFLKGLKEEWAKLNFDETTVYDLKEACRDIKKLCQGKRIRAKEYSKIVSERVPSDLIIDGKDYDCIIVEGIYALDKTVLRELGKAKNVVKDFIAGNAKSLFLRRIIRDSKISSASNAFTTKLYFTSILKSYQETIFPSRLESDILLYNDMAFSEIRAGDLYTTKEEIHILDERKAKKLLSACQVESLAYQKDTYFTCPGEKNDSLVSNVLRLRSLSEDGGKTYRPSSLVHKGKTKLRKDGKIIRPINILVREGEFDKVWQGESDCLKDFLSAGFYIGPVKYKRKYRLDYKGQKLVLNWIEGEDIILELNKPYRKDVLHEVKKLVQ